LTILLGDARSELKSVPDGSVRCCVTSPPYFGLRDYGHEGQIGLENSVDEYINELRAVFREVHRVLADDGTLWLNLGDSYAGKQLIGMPWRVAFALQADGWFLRSDIIWHKPNPMPESVTDRPTKSHEYLFLLSKSSRYFYNHEAIKEPSKALNLHDQTGPARTGIPGQSDHRGKRPARSGNKERKSALERGAPQDRVAGNVPWEGFTRNKRDVWTISLQPFKGAHFAVMPEALVEPCILAGTEPRDTVLDPFAGSGTVGVVAKKHQRTFLGVELNPEYAELAENRINDVQETLF